MSDSDSTGLNPENPIVDTNYDDDETKDTNSDQNSRQAIADLSRTVVMQSARFQHMDGQIADSNVKISKIEQSILDLNNSIQQMLGVQRSNDAATNILNAGNISGINYSPTTPLNANASTFKPNSNLTELEVESKVIGMFQDAHKQNFKIRRLETNTSEIQKLLHKTKLANNVADFPEWNRLILAYFDASGTPQISCMDPYSVPDTIQGWIELDKKCKGSSQYLEFISQLLYHGHILKNTILGTSLEILNTAYLANCRYRLGLASSQASVVEMALDWTAHRDSFLPAEYRNNPCAARYMYFEIYRKFVSNTLTSRLARLGFIVERMRIGKNESPKSFLDRLNKEVTVLTMMVGNHEKLATFWVLGTFMRRVLDCRGSDPRYDTAHQILEKSNPDFSINDIAAVWNRIWLDSREEPPGDPVTAYTVDISGTGSFEDFKASSAADTAYNSVATKPKKLGKDADGKLLCWQYAKHKKCEFGPKCKFSHKPAAPGSEDLVFLTDDTVIQQTKTNIEHAHKALKRKFQKKYKQGIKQAQKKFSNISNKKLKFTSPTNSAPAKHTNLQDTIAQYAKNKTSGEQANTAKGDIGKSIIPGGPNTVDQPESDSDISISELSDISTESIYHS